MRGVVQESGIYKLEDSVTNESAEPAFRVPCKHGRIFGVNEAKRDV